VLEILGRVNPQAIVGGPEAGPDEEGVGVGPDYVGDGGHGSQGLVFTGHILAVVGEPKKKKKKVRKEEEEEEKEGGYLFLRYSIIVMTAMS
jgi:hypothetical protein